MFKSILVGLLLMISTSAIAHHSVIHNNTIQVGGAVQCQTYNCQRAQDEIRYLLNAIYWERQKPSPCWSCIRNAQQRINFLRTIK